MTQKLPRIRLFARTVSALRRVGVVVIGKPNMNSILLGIRQARGQDKPTTQYLVGEGIAIIEAWLAGQEQVRTLPEKWDSWKSRAPLTYSPQMRVAMERVRESVVRGKSLV